MSALQIKEVTPIGLTYARGAVNPIGACVLGFKGGANWSGTYVCCVIFLKNNVHFR